MKQPFTFRRYSLRCKTFNRRIPMRCSTRHGLLLYCIATTAAAAAIVPRSALACRISVAPKLEDVRYADVVVIGRIDNYRIIRDEAFRRQMLASPNLPANMRKLYEDPKQGLMPDYARFDIKVEQVLFGRSRGRLSVTWDNSTFGEPDQIVLGRYLIALRRPDSTSPPLRGPSATILPSADRNALTVLQAPCSSAFIYEAESEPARKIREILSVR